MYVYMLLHLSLLTTENPQFFCVIKNIMYLNLFLVWRRTFDCNKIVTINRSDIDGDVRNKVESMRQVDICGHHRYVAAGTRTRATRRPAN